MLQESGVLDYTKLIEAIFGFASVFVTAAAGLISGALAYVAKGWWDGRKEKAALEQSDEADQTGTDSPEGWARMYSRARYLIESKQIERVLFLLADSKDGVPTSMSVFYSECCAEIKPRFDPVKRYSDVTADEFYESMLLDIDEKIVWLIRDEMPTCKLKGYYEDEKVHHAGVGLIKKIVNVNVNGENEKIKRYYLCVMRYETTPFPRTIVREIDDFVSYSRKSIR